MAVGTHGNGIYYTFLGAPNFTPNQSTGITPVTNDRNFIRLIAPTFGTSQVNYQIGNMTGIKRISIQVMSMTGQVVWKEERGYSNGSVPLDRLSRGMYILNIVSNDNRYRHVQKIVRQ
jgi:hypothetical protein